MGLSANFVFAQAPTFQLVGEGTSVLADAVDPGNWLDEPSADTQDPTWTPLADATGAVTYDLSFINAEGIALTQNVVEGNTYELTNLTCDTDDNDDDGVGLFVGECVMNFDWGANSYANGLYEWTVTASDDDGSYSPDAGPFYVVINRVNNAPVNDGPLAFNLLTPADDETLFQADVETILADGVDITWDDAGANVDTYDFLLTLPDETTSEFLGLTPADDTDVLTCAADVCTLAVDAVTAATIFTQDGTYSWVVTATDDDDTPPLRQTAEITTSSLETFTFDVDTTADVSSFALSGPGTQVAPGPAIDVPEADVEVTWTDPTDATSFDFTLIQPDGTEVLLDGLTPAVDTDALDCDGTTCTLTAPFANLTAEGTYSWVVVATDGDGNSAGASNQPFFFTVAEESAGPSAFALVSPADEAVVTDTSTVTAITWEDPTDATSFDFTLTFPDFSVATFGDLTPAVADGTDPLDCDAGTCTLTVDGSTVLDQDGEYSWNVVATDGTSLTASNNGPYTFTVDTAVVGDPPSPFALLTPANGTVLDALPAGDISVTWEDPGDADTFDFTLTKPGELAPLEETGLTPADDTDGLVCAADTCTYTLDAVTEVTVEGPYTWDVEATNTNGSTASNNGPYGFFVDVAETGPGTFALLTPTDGTTLTAIADFTEATWEVSTDATTYDLAITKPDNAVFGANGLTPADDTDALTCTDTGTDDTCTFTVDDPNAILDTNGVYSWSVVANSAEGVTLADAPFSFTLDVEVVETTPADFNLLSPMDGALVLDPTTIDAITWDESVSEDGTLVADTYDFYLFQLSNNPASTRIGEIVSFIGLTPAAEDDALTCVAPAEGEASVCTLVVDGAAAVDGLTTGFYSWTVQANLTSVATSAEAANGPYFFSVNTGDVELLTNGGFETNEDGDKVPDDWKLKANNGGDALKCNKIKDGELKVKANSGECAFQIKGSGVNVKTRLQQNVQDVSFLQTGDTVTVSFYAKIKAAGNVALAKVIVKSTDIGEDGKPEKDKVTLRAPETPVGSEYELITDDLPITVDNIEKFKVQLFYRLPTGKVFYDDVSALLTADSGATVLDPAAPLPLPDAPPSFRN